MKTCVSWLEEMKNIHFYLSISKIHFSNPAIQPCYFDTTKLKITLDQEPYEEIFGPVSMYIAIYAKQKSIFIQQFFFFLVFPPQIELFLDLKSFENIERCSSKGSKRSKKLFPRINRERFIRGIRRFRRNSWFSLRPSPNVAPIFRDKLYLVSKNSFTLCFRYTWRL